VGGTIVEVNESQSDPESIRLLVCEDDEPLADGLCRNLELEGFSVLRVGTGEDALVALARRDSGYELLILDIMLPGIDGFEVCRRLRDDGDMIPILFLTARGSDADRILGLQLGADDYLTKPFLVEELVLRVRGIMRRAEWSQSPARTGPVVKIGGNEVNMDTMRASTPEGAVALTEREVMLVRFFSENDGRVLTRGELLERVWGYTFDTSTRTLDTFVHRLRKHFEEDPRNPRHFHTVRGVGYRFTAEPEE
jgi:two-component system alkaline phosphatase synthesis response regulator PhoP